MSTKKLTFNSPIRKNQNKESKEENNQRGAEVKKWTSVKNLNLLSFNVLPTQNLVAIQGGVSWKCFKVCESALVSSNL